MKKEAYAVFGHPISHSLSPWIHAQFAKESGESEHFSYEAICPPKEGFAEAIAAFIATGGKGANVTLPFKEEAFALSNHVSERAKKAQAVNTLSFTENGIFGDNTDGVGLLRDLTQSLEVSIAGKRILLLGAGGAARGVVFPLLQENPHSLVIANRTNEKAAHLAASFQDKRCFALPFSDLADLKDQAFDLVINATSMSLQTSNIKDFPLPASVFAKNRLAYEMMYGKHLLQKSPFCQIAQSAGAKLADGLGMLVQQAAESFFIWRQKRPETKRIQAALRAR